MHDRSEWTRGATGPVTLKGKKYKELVQFSRPCATCTEPFAIYVTKVIASGKADSNSFGLKNCAMHRRNKVGAEIGDEYSQVVTERNEAWELNTDLMSQNADLRRRLATYELPAAMAAAQNKMPWEA